MTARRLAGILLACAGALWPVAGWGQTAPANPCVATAEHACNGDPAGTPSPSTERAQDAPPGESGFKRFVKDVGGDYKHYFSKETAFWIGGGLAAAGLVHVGDEEIAEEMSEESATTRALEGGDKYGNMSFQVPLAVGWWVIGHAAGSARGAEAGRDLLRAQISAASWAYAWKYAVDRTRPNGDPRSFPSGHAAATFATAMVLQDHYGWKVGVPLFAASTYTAISRLSINKHWASDVTFGAFIGMASARTVTLHVRNQRFALSPLAVPGGGGVAFVHVD